MPGHTPGEKLKNNPRNKRKRNSTKRGARTGLRERKRVTEPKRGVVTRLPVKRNILKGATFE